MSHCGRLTNIPGGATNKVGVGLMLTLFLYLMQASPVHAHGAHAIFLSPAVGQEVTGSVELHVDATPQPFPYINVAIRALDTQQPLWEDLVPREDNGYRRVIDLEGWKPGEYWIEVQFPGDLVEQFHKRSFVIQSLVSRTGSKEICRSAISASGCNSGESTSRNGQSSPELDSTSFSIKDQQTRR